MQIIKEIYLIVKYNPNYHYKSIKNFHNKKIIMSNMIMDLFTKNNIFNKININSNSEFFRDQYLTKI